MVSMLIQEQNPSLEEEIFWFSILRNEIPLDIETMNFMKKNSFYFIIAVFLFSTFTNHGFSHCQIPCGIFHDDLVFNTLEQNIETLQKAVQELATPGISNNQSVRWILNKEKQCDDIAQTMLTYFLQQRVKTDDPKRAEKLDLIASICMQCTKVKQTVDISEVNTLGKEIQDLKKLVLSSEKKQ